MTQNEPSTTTRRLRPLAFAAAALLLTAAAGLWAPACGRTPERPPQPPTPAHPAATDILLTVDGISITFGDLAKDLAFLDGQYPEFAERKKIEGLLTRHTLPLVFARREFAKERAEQLALARTFQGALGNVAELEQHRGDRPHRRVTLVAGDLDVPVAAFVFDPGRTGAVSEPIEVPQGFVVAGAFDLQAEREVVGTRADCLQVFFYTHASNFWGDWLQGLHQRLRDRVTYVHPDYRLAMPPWLKLP